MLKASFTLWKKNKTGEQLMLYLLVPNIEPPFPVQPLTDVQVMGSICSETNKYMKTKKHTYVTNTTKLVKSGYIQWQWLPCTV